MQFSYLLKTIVKDNKDYYSFILLLLGSDLVIAESAIATIIETTGSAIATIIATTD